RTTFCAGLRDDVDLERPAAVLRIFRERAAGCAGIRHQPRRVGSRAPAEGRPGAVLVQPAALDLGASTAGVTRARPDRIVGSRRGDDVISMPRYFKPWYQGLPALRT